MQAGLLGVAAACGAVTLAAMGMERRRARRRFTHGPGWMPWPTLVMAGAFGALIALGLALKS